MSAVDVNQDLSQKAFSMRERIAIRLLLLLVELVYPAKYAHQLDKMVENIKTEIGL